MLMGDMMEYRRKENGSIMATVSIVGEAGIAAGASCLTHLFNAMNAVSVGGGYGGRIGN